MIKQSFSVTRTRATWKPRVAAADLPFYEEDGHVFLGVSGSNPAAFSGSGRSLVAEPPYLGMHGPESAASAPLIELADLPAEIQLNYAFEGGFNNNCLKVFWEIQGAEYTVEWVCLKTFTGTQLKYAMPKKRPPLLFAFADEDAFVYCDKSPCDECAFRCKSGFVAYIRIKNLGIVRMPLERISSLRLQK